MRGAFDVAPGEAVSALDAMRTLGLDPDMVLILPRVLALVITGFVTARSTGLEPGTVAMFGAAALLFLVTEELLVEAHEEPETPLLTTTFFAGFLLILILGMYA